MARHFISQLSATALFVEEWIHRPQQIGAIAPSSRNLSSAMAAWLPAGPEEYVLELGPGTGSVTEALLERGLRHDRLIAIEKSPRMAGLLRSRFPRVRIITGDAAHMDRFMRKQFRQVENVGAVISSLPLRVFPSEVADGLVKKIHTLLRPGGVWVQFSYCLGRSQPRGAAQFQLLDSSLVLLNLPPARVSVFQKPLGS